MPISRERFELALERLKDSDWERFENLSSAFLASEYSALRTMAAPGGDGGRDAVLFRPEDEPNTAAQYSVQKTWDAKIRATAKRLKEHCPETTLFLFVSNQEIGARADKLKREIAKDGLHIDIRDRSWFLDRMNQDANRAEAAVQIARAIVDPLLEGKGILTRGGALSRAEANTALVFLELQRQDDTNDKGLTRSCFEALVKAALEGSSKESPVGKDKIYSQVYAYLPTHESVTLKPFVDAALNRLTRHAIEKIEDHNYYLSSAEAEKIKNASARLVLMREDFNKDVLDILSESSGVTITRPDELVESVHKIVQLYFLKKGEEFATCVARDTMPPLDEADLKSIVVEHLARSTIKGRNPIELGLVIVTSLLSSHSPRTQAYLKLMSDAYTLMSFLGETPDVQAATKKLFSHGDIWLDASVLLPVFPETSYETDLRPFTTLYQQARRAGLKLYVTAGVIEEIERHLNRCRAYARAQNWQGNVPYVAARYIIAGGKRAELPSWLEQFAGTKNPIQDLAEYFSDEFSIEREDVPDTSQIPTDVSTALSEYWRGVHEVRRGDQVFDMTIDRLTRHDVENCLAVLADRQRDSGKSRLGHSSWWLTVDRAAANMPRKIDRDVWSIIKDSPVLSLDFLLKYLAFGPARDRVSDLDRSEARIFSPPLMESLPEELVKVAEKVRAEFQGLPERIIQRRIRDGLDVEKAHLGQIHEAGLEGIDEALLRSF